MIISFLQQKKSLNIKKAFVSIFIFFSAFFPLSFSEAAINKQINYQGKLTTSAGVAVANGTYVMEFKLYTVPTAGTAIWTETRTAGDEVQVTNGLFSVMLGEVTALTGVDFNQTLYLGVKIESDAEMTPRKKLGTVPSAVVAEGALNIIGGAAGAVPYQSAANTTLFSAVGIAGQALISGAAGSPTWFAPTLGSVLFAGTSGALTQDNTNFFWDDTNKRLGIGMANPETTLDVIGGIRTTTNGFAVGNLPLASSTAILRTVNDYRIVDDGSFGLNNATTRMMTVRTTGVAIGTNVTPTAKLHLPAGTATASTAPLKFTSGTNLTTPEAGAMEWDGTNLFITQTTGPTRKTIAYTSDLTTGYIPYTGGTSDVDLGVHNLTVDTNSLFVDATNHRVGVGTVTPGSMLTIGDTAMSSVDNGVVTINSYRIPLLNINENNASSNFSGLQLQLGGVTRAGFLMNTNSGEVKMGALSTGGFFPTFYSNNSEAMRITSTGLVGIGTTTPLLKLDVAGSGRFTGAATSVLTGSIDPAASTTVTGVGTAFTTQLVAGDRITVTGETRTVTAIASNTSLTVDTAFTDNADDVSPDKLAAIFVARDSSSVVKTTINDLGNMSIGTLSSFTNSGAPLNIRVNAAGVGFVVDSGTAGEYTDFVSGGVVKGFRGFGSVPFMVSSNSDMTLSTNGGSRSDIFIESTNGNVGIGTATPTTNILEVLGGTNRIQVGTGSTTSSGFILGYEGTNSGYSAIWPTSVTPSASNYAFRTGGNITSIGATGGSAGAVVIAPNNSTKIVQNAVAGQGPIISAGTATTDEYALNLSQTWNNGAVAFTGALINPTATSYAAGSTALKIGAGTGAGSNAGYYSLATNGVAGAPNYIAHNAATGQGSLIEFTTANVRKSFIYGQSGGTLELGGSNATGANVLVTGTSGNGMTIVAGTTTGGTEVNALGISQTWNNAATVQTGLKFTITDTASNASSLAFQFLGGAAGTTNLAKLDKSGILTIGGRLSVPTLQGINWTGSSTFIYGRTNSFITMFPGGADIAEFGTTGLQFISSAVTNWSSGALGASSDIGLSRISAGVLGIGTGAQGSYDGTLVAGLVGIGTTAPGELLSLGLTGTTKGVLSFAGNTSGKIIIQPAAIAGTYTLTLPTALGAAGSVLTDAAGDGVLSWAAGSGGGANTALSNLASVAINTDLVGAVAGGLGIRGGTTANDDLILEGTTHATRTTSYVNLQPNGGNVGIGTSSPASKLEINGGTDATTLRTIGTATGLNWSGRMVAGGPSNAFLMGQFNDQAWLGAHNAALNAWAPFYLNPDGTQDLYLGDSDGVTSTNAPIVTIRNTNGRVGIGNTTPDSILHVTAASAGTGAHVGQAFMGTWSGDINTAAFSHYGLSQNNTGYAFIQDGAGHTYVNSQTGQPLSFRIGNSDKMTIDSAGEVGIGTTGPNYPLEVAGLTSTTTARFTGTNTGATWSGRVIAGGPSNAFLMGQFNDQAWLGAHNAALNAWADFYINPDGGSKAYIGDSGGAPTAPVPILTIDNSAGNVGIGNTSPLLKLDVTGSGRFTGAATSVLTGTIDPAASTTVTGVGTLFTTQLVVGDRITVTGETKTVTAIASNTSLTVDTAFTDNANDTLPDKLAAIFLARDSSNVVKTVINDLGRIGVGTVSPSYTIDVASVDGSDPIIRMAGTNTPQIILENTGGAAGSASMYFLGGSASGQSYFGYRNGFNIGTTTGAGAAISSKFMMDSSGKVGIGTIAPSGNLAVSQTATATGALKGIVYTGAVNTNQTLSTEIPAVTFTTAGRQWATGALATQREVLITQPTYSFVGASTITNAATVGIAGAPIASTNATLTNSHGLLIQAGAVGAGVTNSYGLTVNAQTGATNNYAAQFMGGNVGIGTASPSYTLDITGNLHIGSATLTNDSNHLLEVGNSSSNSYFNVGQDATHSFEFGWIYNATPANAYGQIVTYGYTNDFKIDVKNLLLQATSGGKVGIGTTSPLLKLDVAGSGRFTGTATSVLTGTIDPAASTTVTGSGTAFTTQLVVGDRITVTGETRTVTAIASDTSLTVDTAFSNNANDVAPDKLAAIFLARDSSSAVKTVINDLGNVGIGTAAPGGLLQITGTSWRKAILETTGTTAKAYQGSDGNGLNFTTNAYYDGAAWQTDDTAKSKFAYIQHLGTSQMEFRVAPSGAGVTWNTAMVIQDTGLVGVGTTSPSGKFSVSQTATATGVLKGLVYTGAVNTNQTLSTEIPAVTFTTAGRQWATGALTTQREVLITQPTYSFVGASTITDAATVGIAGAPVSSTNATLTNSHGLLIQAGAVGAGTTNAYGLTVNAQTGATNNYSAVFLGGNVGIGTAAPESRFEIKQSADDVFGGLTVKSSSTNAIGAMYVDAQDWININNDDSTGKVNVSNVLFADGNLGNVGIGTTAPGELLSLGLAGTTKGVLSLSGNTSGKIIIQPADAAGTYTLTLPVDDGTPSQFLQTNGSGVLTWATSSGGGATTALDNLASVAINASLLPASDDSIDLGDNTHRWRDLYLGPETLHIGTSTTDEGYLSYTTSTNVLNMQSTGNIALQPTAGNVGIGTTSPVSLLTVGAGTNTYPSTPAGTAAITLNSSTLARLVMNDGTGNFNQYLNSYYDSTAVAHKYQATAAANMFVTSAGTYGFYVAPSGTAGNNITWTTGLYINNSGNIGIGTTAPLSKLQVTGLARVGGEPTYRGDIIIDQTGTAEAAIGGLEFKNDSSANGYGKRILGVFNGVSDYDLRFQTRSNTPTWTTSMTLASTGYLGIGNTSPQAILHAGAGADAPAIGNTSLYVSNAGTTNLSIRDSTNDVELLNYVYSGGGLIGTATAHNLSIRTSNADRITILSGGNVGIGTAAPGYPLDIIGSTRMRYTGAIGNGSAGQSLFFSDSTPTNIAEIQSYDFDTTYYGMNFRGWNGSALATIMSVKGNGNVGIGTTAPAFPLSIYASSVPGMQLVSSTSGSTGTDGFTAALSSDDVYLNQRENKDMYFYTNGAFAAVVKASGNVGIGQTTPATKLNVSDTFPGAFNGPLSFLINDTASATNHMFGVDRAGYVEFAQVGNAGSSHLCYDGSSPNSTFKAAYFLSTCSSSIRYKTNVQPLAVDKEKVFALQPVTFDWKKNGKPDIGMIAEEVVQQIPALVFYKDGQIEGVNYDKLPIYLLEIAKEQDKVLADLNLSITNLKLSVTDMDTRLAALEANVNTGGDISSLGEFAVDFFNAGVEGMVDGIAYMKGIVVGSLKVGSPDMRTGITLYDEVTGSPNCFSISNGAVKTTLGECAVITPSTEELADSSYSPTDANAPIITLDGETLISMDVGSTYVESGAFAKDADGNELAVIIDGSVDTSTPGTYTITYSATSGTTASVTRTVAVVDTTTAPTETTPTPGPAPEPNPEPVVEPTPAETPTTAPEPTV